MNRAVLSTALAVALATACSQPPASETPPAAPKSDQQPAATNPPTPAAKVEHGFRGKVEKVDAAAKKLTVNGENVEGWMGAMTMDYGADKPEIFNAVKAGDQITAKVYDGDFGTLHDVQIVAADKK